MFPDFSGVNYLPVLKWKQGEYTAVKTIRHNAKKRLLPLFVVPASGGYDHETGRILSPIEHLRLFGPRLGNSWGKRPAFVDGVHIDDQKHKEGLRQHPLTELLERARLAGAIACPVTAIGRSREYQQAVARFVRSHAPLPICIRVDAAAHLESATLAEDLGALLTLVDVQPSRCALTIDFGANVALSDPEAFASVLIEWLNRLPWLHDWLLLSVALTSFPEKIALAAGQSQIYPRSDWTVFQHLCLMRERLLRLPVFGDYAVDYPRYAPSRPGVMPTAMLRYSLPNGYLIHKGTSTRKPYGFEAIYPVAAALVSCPEFMGASYSRGDAFLDKLGHQLTGTGNASTWRWAATDHHLETVDGGLRSLLGLPHEEPEPIEPPDNQMALFRSENK